MNLKQILHGLLAIPAPSGFERQARQPLSDLLGGMFDEHITTPVGNHIFVKGCGKKNAPRLLLDAHFDTIGFLVSDVLDSGHVRVVNLGGIDRRSLVAAEVTIHAEQDIHGVFTAPSAVPMSDADAKKLPELKECFIFTELTAEELRAKGVRVGVPVTYRNAPLDLGECVVAPGMDNRVSAAALVHAVQLLEGEKLPCDIHLLLSSTEEVANQPGAKTGAFATAPQAAIIVDVSWGHSPDGGDKSKCSELGKGADITRSIEVSRAMAEEIIALAVDKEIPHQVSLSPRYTGTNNSVIAYSNAGVPSAVIGIPLRNMHTANEVALLSDVEAVAKLVAEYAKTFKGGA
ncbi:MAG: hypothetical protein FWB93_01445 [Oscillospiraceae bacterium]|nr:hypothetical protein [Oscillospiraceae bacterium]